MEETITIYRNPGLNLNHFLGDDGERTVCKHYRIAKMNEIIQPVTHAGVWCTDCFMALKRKEQANESD
jgi:hypothetical protein